MTKFVKDTLCGFITIRESPFYNWAPGEPNNDQGREHCCMVGQLDHPFGTWNDFHCTGHEIRHMYRFICKRTGILLTVAFSAALFYSLSTKNIITYFHFNITKMRGKARIMNITTSPVFTM